MDAFDNRLHGDHEPSRYPDGALGSREEAKIMGQEEVTRLILDALRRPASTRPTQVTLVDGRRVSVRIAGIECFGEIRSVEVIEQFTGERSLIPYTDIARLET